LQPRILGILECAAASVAQTKLRATKGAQLRLKTYVRRHYAIGRPDMPESDLVTSFLRIVSDFLGRSLQGVKYADPSLSSIWQNFDPNIDIVGLHVEIQFEGELDDPLFLHWGSSESTIQYILMAKRGRDYTPDSMKLDVNVNSSAIWRQVVGHSLASLSLYGVQKLEWGTELLYNQPFAALLEFENGRGIGLANSYAERDFRPRIPYGDDIWIMEGNSLKSLVLNPLSLDFLGESKA